MIFGIETRKELKEKILSLEVSCDSLLSEVHNREIYANMYAQIINTLICCNTETPKFDGTECKLRLLRINTSGAEEVEDNDEPIRYNASAFANDDKGYLYLSKKLTDGYKYLSISFKDNDFEFVLNNNNVGLELDSNNRFNNKLILLLIKMYFSIQEEKFSLFFEKI